MRTWHGTVLQWLRSELQALWKHSFCSGLIYVCIFSNLSLLWSCPGRGRSSGVVEGVTLDVPKAARSIESDDHNKFAMGSKSLCRLLKERIAPSLPLEDSTVTQNSPGIAQPQIKGWEILSLQITVNYWFWYLLSQAQRLLVFFCLQFCFSPRKSLTGQCILSGWWHPLKSGVLYLSCRILHVPKAPKFK